MQARYAVLDHTNMPYPLDRTALADLGASLSVMPLSTYLNLGLGELAHTKLTVELADRTVKYLKGIVENVLIGIGTFVFLVDFIILDIPEDIKVPLILRRPFLSTAHAKIDVFKRKITLRVGKEKIIFKSVKPASSLIKRVYMLSLRERMELDLEARLMGETLVLNRSLDPFFEDYIELNDLNVPLELRRDQVDDLMPTIEEGEVVEEFRARNDARMVSKIFGYPSDCDHDKKIRIDCAHNLKFSCMIDFAVLEDMDAYRDEGMGDVIFGEPFLREVGINAKRFEGMITIHNGNEEVTYQMVRSHPRFKHHTNEQCNKIPPLLKDLAAKKSTKLVKYQSSGILCVIDGQPEHYYRRYIRLEEEKAQKRGKVFNRKTAKYGKIWYDEDVHELRSVETEFPAIVFNDNLTVNETLSCEPTGKLVSKNGYGILAEKYGISTSIGYGVSNFLIQYSVFCEDKKGSYVSKAYSYGALHIDKSIPRLEKDPGCFTLPCYINNVYFNNALADLGASVSTMPLSTYLNLGLGELSHTKLTVKLEDRTVKYPKGIAENMLVETLVLNRSLDHFFGDYIELNDLNVPLELRRVQVEDLMPTIKEGEVIEEFRARNDARMTIFVGTFPILTDFAVLEDMDAYRDEGMGDDLAAKKSTKLVKYLQSRNLEVLES
ncbi:putative reverse transcriptase domain-containing protein [Tanacetum coccineum]